MYLLVATLLLLVMTGGSFSSVKNGDGFSMSLLPSRIYYL